MGAIKNKIKSKFEVDIDYEKSMSYFNGLIDGDKEVGHIYESIKEGYSERLKKGTLNIKYEKLKIQERQGKLKGSGEEFQFSYYICLIGVIFTVIIQNLFSIKNQATVAMFLFLGVIAYELLKGTKSNRSINMTLGISFMVLEELENEERTNSKCMVESQCKTNLKKNIISTKGREKVKR